MARKLLWFITILIAVVSLGLFFLPNISPAELPLSAFAFIFIPIAVIINIILLLYWYLASPKNALLPLLIVLFSFTYLKRTVAVHFNKNEKGEFNILSYNVRVFNVYSHLQDKNHNSTHKMMTWIANNKAGVKCFQEFYNNDSSDIFCSIKKLRATMPYYYFSPFHTDNSGGSFGMAIFSRYPIVDKGFIRFKERSNNHIIYADIKIGKDTLRAFNIHLQSLHITDPTIIEARLNEIGKDDVKQILRKISTAAVMRGRQIDIFDKCIKQSPYKVIICGDLNDTPYSYSYDKLCNYHSNAFEKAGNGLGFTYISKFPLRIDNEFADERLDIKNFTVYDTVAYSDHYPIEGSFSIKN